jgi:CDP-diacylglycerol--glycerol-3-phosphate 3-phosphatidyltransferase
VLAAETMGKHKTAWQIITILFFLSLLSLDEAAYRGWLTTGAWMTPLKQIGGTALLTLAVGLTLYSGSAYFWRNRALVKTH